MADTTYEVLILRARENDGGAYLRKGAQASEETMTVWQARERLGDERVISMLLNAIDAVRRSSTK